MKNSNLKRRIQRIRKKVKSVNKDRFRLSVHKTNKNIFAQIIDDKESKTLVFASSVEKPVKQNEKLKKSDLSNLVGELLAKRAIEKKINKVYFDRGKHRYHGRVKLLAESLRKNGMKI